LFCENEHGFGDVCFPDIDKMDAFEIKNLVVENKPVYLLRAEAKRAGWRRVNGADYCPACMNSM
jgi:hypothetical protein